MIDKKFKKIMLKVLKKHRHTFEALAKQEAKEKNVKPKKPKI